MPRWIAVSLALFVTFLWSTSYILNRWAFAEGIGPLTLAGLRYGLAALTLAAVRSLWRGRPATAVPGPTRWQYVGLGLAGYLVAQGFQYVGQYYVTPTQASMLLSFGNTALVLLVGWFWLRERPGPLQAFGILVAMLGVMLYYYPWGLGQEALLGGVMILLSGIGYAAQLTANRSFLQRGAATALDLVLFPMLVGAAAMVVLGLCLEPWPTFSGKLLLLLLWLGPVNGAAAFFLWTYSQTGLQAFESSVLNNSMLLQIAALDVALLQRSLSPLHMISLALAGVGILVVQAGGRASRVGRPRPTHQISRDP